MNNRRGFLSGLLSLVQLPPPVVCQHEWSDGPFYVAAAMGPKEPKLYSPSGLLRTEHCILCGTLRLPQDQWNSTGSSLMDPQAIILVEHP